MKYRNVADIFTANAEARERLTATLGGISPHEATAMPDGEKWSIQHIAEHVSKVNSGIAMICGKMLADARADEKPSDGSFSLTPEYEAGIERIATMKLEAPERVQPTGQVTIDEALKRLEENVTTFAQLRPGLESINVDGHTFPHPYLGPLTALQWLVMAGLHERRHTRQIEKLAEKIRQEKVPG